MERRNFIKHIGLSIGGLVGLGLGKIAIINGDTKQEKPKLEKPKRKEPNKIWLRSCCGNTWEYSIDEAESGECTTCNTNPYILYRENTNNNNSEQIPYSWYEDLPNIEEVFSRIH